MFVWVGLGELTATQNSMNRKTKREVSGPKIFTIKNTFFYINNCFQFFLPLMRSNSLSIHSKCIPIIYYSENYL